MDTGTPSVIVSLTISLLAGSACQRSKVPVLEPYPGSAKYCDEHVVGGPGGSQLNWTGYHTTDPVEKVVGFYMKLYGSGNHVRLNDEDVWRFPPEKPERVLSVANPKDAPPSNLCKPVPKTAQTVVIISTLTRP